MQSTLKVGKRGQSRTKDSDSDPLGPASGQRSSWESKTKPGLRAAGRTARGCAGGGDLRTRTAGRCWAAPCVLWARQTSSAAGPRPSEGTRKACRLARLGNAAQPQTKTRAELGAACGAKEAPPLRATMCWCSQLLASEQPWHNITSELSFW